MKNVRKLVLSLALTSVIFMATSCHGQKAPEISIDEKNYPNVKLYPELINGYWWFNGENSGLLAVDDSVPTISENKTWVVGGKDTGIQVIYKDTYIKYDVPSSFDTSKEYNISFWDKNDTNEVQRAIYEDAIASFEKYYPNIHVKIQHFTDYNAIYEKVITNIATNTTPNVCISYPDHVATYLSGNNIITPLDDLMNDAKYGLGGNSIKFESVKKEEIVDKYLNEGIINSHYYTMPFMRSSEALYMNQDLIESLGFKVPDIPTWDWVFSVCEEAIRQKKANQEMLPFIYKSEDNMMIQMLKQLGGEYSTNSGEVKLFNETTKSILEYIRPHAENGEFSSFTLVQYPGNKLNSGKAIFGIDSTAGATWMGTDGPNQSIDASEIVKFKTAVRCVPQFDPEHPQMISQGPSLCLFNKKDPQEVLASWLFLQFLITNETQINYSKTEGYVPVTYKAINSSVYRDYLAKEGEDNNEHYYVKIQASKLVINNFDNTFITPVFNGSASLRQAAGQLIVELLRSVSRKDTINDAYYTQLFDKMSKLFRITEIGNQTQKQKEDWSFASVPTGGKVLVFSILGIWVLIGVYYIYSQIRKKQNKSFKR